MYVNVQEAAGDGWKRGADRGREPLGRGVPGWQCKALTPDPSALHHQRPSADLAERAATVIPPLLFSFSLSNTRDTGLLTDLTSPLLAFLLHLFSSCLSSLFLVFLYFNSQLRLLQYLFSYLTTVMFLIERHPSCVCTFLSKHNALFCPTLDLNASNKVGFYIYTKSKKCSHQLKKNYIYKIVWKRYI